MDERSENILSYLVYHTRADNREIMQEFSISRNQLNYSIKKINNWCQEKNFPTIKRTKTGHFYLAKELLAFFNQTSNETQTMLVAAYSESERCTIAQLMIFMKQGYISLDYFMLDLDISKNTAMRTLKLLREKLPVTVKLTYARDTGYDFQGDEWELRKLLIKTIYAVKESQNGLWLLEKFMVPLQQQIIDFRKKIEVVEEIMEVQFSDDRLELLPYILAAIADRFDKGAEIEDRFDIAYSLLADTKEYMAASKLFENWLSIPSQEKLFVTLQLLTTNIISGDILTEDLTKKLSIILDECLVSFEKKACVTLTEKEQLKERMLLHMKPAFYRIRYHLSLQMKIEDTEIDPQYYLFKEIIREAFQPLERFIEAPIPEEEFTFITFFVLSALSETRAKQGTCTAVVVCKSGVLISQTLNTFLQKIFPEFIFLPPCSLRQFAALKNQVDVVFSTVPLKDVQNLFMVKPLMKQHELETLRNHVFHEINGGVAYNAQVTFEHVLSVVKKHTHIVDQHLLESELADIFYTKKEVASNWMMNSEIGLLHLLKEENIQIVDRVEDCKEAIFLASRPLIENKSIQEEYVQAMIEVNDLADAYIILGDQVAIPHARPEDGVNRLAISLLYVREGVFFSLDQSVHFVFVIAPINHEKHIDALFEIMAIAEDQKMLKAMRESQESEELIQILKTVGRGVCK